MIVKSLRGSRQHRRGVAVVELAFMMPLLLMLIVGVWEIGRLVQLQTIMNEAARDGARIASQAVIINTLGAYTEIDMTTSTPNVTDTIKEYLYGCGITNLTGLQITFAYIDGDTTLTQPYQGVKNQRFRITVSLPYANMKWTSLSLINPSTLGAQCDWNIMVDDPFTVSTTLPGWSP